MKCVMVGIDPGKNGGIAIRHTCGRVVAHAMPETRLDTADLLKAEVLAAQAEGHIIEVTMELVGGYAGGAGQPGSSMFEFGAGFGGIEVGCYILGVRLTLVRPQAWQKALSLGNKKDHDGETPAKRRTAWKNHLKARAQQLFPQQKVTLKTADALLILEFANRTKPNNP